MPPDRPGARPATARIPRCTEAERGYDVVQVDELLAGVHAALQDAPPGPGPCRARSLTPCSGSPAATP